MLSSLGEALPIIANAILVLMLLGGIVGSALPAVPGSSLIWLGVVLHGIMTGWEPLGLGIQITTAVLTLVSLGCQSLVTALGAKRTGATLWGAVGAMFGLMFGFLIPIPVLGPLAGAFGGALLAEHLATGKKGTEVLKAGAGAVGGALLGTVAEFVIALVMVLIVGLAFFT
jgi:hypothetical protein